MIRTVKIPYKKAIALQSALKAKGITSHPKLFRLEISTDSPAVRRVLEGEGVAVEENVNQLSLV